MRSAAIMVEEHTAAHTKASASRNLTLSTHMSLYMSTHMTELIDQPSIAII